MGWRTRGGTGLGPLVDDGAVHRTYGRRYIYVGMCVCMYVYMHSKITNIGWGAYEKCPSPSRPTMADGPSIGNRALPRVAVPQRTRNESMTCAMVASFSLFHWSLRTLKPIT